MEIFPVISMKPSMGTRSMKMTRNGPWRILRQAALNWVQNKWETSVSVCQWGCDKQMFKHFL